MGIESRGVFGSDEVLIPRRYDQNIIFIQVLGESLPRVGLVGGPCKDLVDGSRGLSLSRTLEGNPLPLIALNGDLYHIPR